MTATSESSPPSAPAKNGPRARAQRRQRHWSWALAASVVTLSVWYGSIRLPMGAAGGTALPGQTAQRSPNEATRFRLGTFNIHGGRGPDGITSLARTAACLKDAHLVGLNEVQGRWFWEDTDQAEALGRRLNYDWLFAPSEERWGHYQFGNGALSTLPVRSWQRIPLVRRTGKGYRNVVHLAVSVGERTVQVLVTHLDRRSDLDRLAQLQAVSALFLALAPPGVLMGDLNTPPDAPEMQQLLATKDVDDPLKGLPLGNAAGRIDWIITRGLTCRDRGMIDAGASDHAYFWVECEL